MITTEISNFLPRHVISQSMNMSKWPQILFFFGGVEAWGRGDKSEGKKATIKLIPEFNMIMMQKLEITYKLHISPRVCS